MTLRTRLILITTAVVTVLFGISEWLNYQQTAALLDQHETILRETADHAVALDRLKATREQMFVSTTTFRIAHAVGTLIVAVAILNYVWFRVVYRPISRLLSQINIMKRGTWTAALPVKRNDEIGQLTAAFNDLGQQLALTFDYVHTSSKLSALALIGNRLIREITAVRARVEAALHALEARGRPNIPAAISTLSAGHEQLRILEKEFESEFDRQLTAVASDRRGGAEESGAPSTAS